MLLPYPVKKKKVGGRYVPTEASLDSSWVQIEVVRDSVSSFRLASYKINHKPVDSGNEFQIFFAIIVDGGITPMNYMT